jgi:hypothetical protein
MGEMGGGCEMSVERLSKQLIGTNGKERSVCSYICEGIYI